MKRAMITLAVLLAAATGFGQSHPATQGDFVIPDGGTTSQAIHVYGYGIGGVWIGPCASATPTTLTVTMAPNAMTEPAAGLFATLDTYAIAAGVASASVFVAFDLEVTPCLQWTKLVVDTGPTGETWPIQINYTPRMVGPLAFSGGDFTLGLTDSLRWGGDTELYRFAAGRIASDDGDSTGSDGWLHAQYFTNLTDSAMTIWGFSQIGATGDGNAVYILGGYPGTSSGEGGGIIGAAAPGRSGSNSGSVYWSTGAIESGAGTVGDFTIDNGDPGGGTAGDIELGPLYAAQVNVTPMISLEYVLQLEEVTGDPTAKPAEGMCFIWKTDGTAGIGAAGDILTACTESAVTRRAVLYAFAGGVVW